ncbi:doublecortin domain-containing protein 2-like [Sardina pilchardus]|uniref:doublecortin domain-containing protein 2-like n=1 Tax=Sardina pilchardus TaxID=27697 RepID=UPI002E1352F6
MAGVAKRPSHARLSKTVLVYRNGDGYFPGKRFVINPRQLVTFDSFLNAVTCGIAAPFGAVRNVYTPHEGHRVSSYDTLEHGEKYVVGGTERFKKLDYINIKIKKPHRKTREMIQPVVHSTINVPARWRRILYEPCTINVFTNGDILVPAVRILLPKYTLLSWDSVLAMVTEKVHLRTGAVHKLCRLDGTPITSSRQLESNQYYVGVGTERFRLLPYFHWVPRKNIVQEGSFCDFLPPAPKKGKSRGDLFADPKHYENSLFYAKSNKRPECYARQKSGSSKTQPLFSSGEGSVFRAKHSRVETTGAAEVPEDTHTQVVLPTDKMEASVVEEELCETTEHTTCQSRTPTPRSKMEPKKVEEKQCDVTTPEMYHSETPSAMSKEEPPASCGRLTRILAPNEHFSLPHIDSAPLSTCASVASAPPAPSD